MQVPMQITVRDMEHSDALDTAIRERVARLEHFHPRITSCRVTVAEAHKHRQKGRHFEVGVDVRVPGHAEVVASRQHAEDVYVALRDAFDSAARQLEEVVREQRGDVKVHEAPLEGTVVRINAEEGYGFVATSDGRELYFSRENVAYPEFEHLQPGTSVQFLEAAGAEGPQAKRVSAGKHHPQPA